jgi:hypothetical protein
MQTTSYEETHDGVRLLRAPIPAGDDRVFVERAAQELSGMIDGSPAHWPLLSLVFIQRTDELLCFPLFGADEEVLRGRFDALLGQAPAQQLAITTWAISDVTGEEIACLSIFAARDSAGLTPDTFRSAELADKVRSFDLIADVFYAGETRMLGPWREARAPTPWSAAFVDE